jgi:hypothetical protein
MLNKISISMMVYYVYFHSAMMYVIIFWGNSIDSNKVFFSAKEDCENNIGN